MMIKTTAQTDRCIEAPGTHVPPPVIGRHGAPPLALPEKQAALPALQTDSTFSVLRHLFK